MPGWTIFSFPIRMIGPAKALRLAELSRRAKLSVGIDNTTALETIAEAARASNNAIGVLVEFDSGNKRTGESPPWRRRWNWRAVSRKFQVCASTG